MVGNLLMVTMCGKILSLKTNSNPPGCLWLVTPYKDTNTENENNQQKGCYNTPYDSCKNICLKLSIPSVELQIYPNG